MRGCGRCGYSPGVEILVGALGFGLGCMLLIESIPSDWRKAIGGLILIAALRLGLGNDH